MSVTIYRSIKPGEHDVIVELSAGVLCPTAIVGEASSIAVAHRCNVAAECGLGELANWGIFRTNSAGHVSSRPS